MLETRQEASRPSHFVHVEIEAVHRVRPGHSEANVFGRQELTATSALENEEAEGVALEWKGTQEQRLGALNVNRSKVDDMRRPDELKGPLQGDRRSYLLRGGRTMHALLPELVAVALDVTP